MPLYPPLEYRRGVIFFALLALALCLAATLALYARQPPILLRAANKLGPAADSLVHGRGLAVCYGATDTTCFHAQRMPGAPLFLAGLYLLFRERGTPAALFKTLLCFAPVIWTFTLAWRRARGCNPRVQLATLCLFLVVVSLPPTLDLASNLNFEEAYFYGWFTLAVALVVLPEGSSSHPVRWAAILWVALVLCYLAKSSMLPAVSFLAVLASARLVRSARKPALAAVFFLAVAAVPLLWGLRQWHSSGHFAVGTSLDGANLYKGNNALFLRHYPAFRGASLDDEEADLFAGRVSLTDEWDENAYGMAATGAYIYQHPLDTLRADLRKASVFFLGVQRDAGEEKHSRLLDAAFTAGMVIFRVMLLLAMALAIKRWRTAGGERFAAAVFLGTVLCVAAPYVAGFALARHATILILPSAVYLCRVLCRETRRTGARPA